MSVKWSIRIKWDDEGSQPPGAAVLGAGAQGGGEEVHTHLRGAQCKHGEIEVATNIREDLTVPREGPYLGLLQLALYYNTI